MFFACKSMNSTRFLLTILMTVLLFGLFCQPQGENSRRHNSGVLTENTFLAEYKMLSQLIRNISVKQFKSLRSKLNTTAHFDSKNYEKDISVVQNLRKTETIEHSRLVNNKLPAFNHHSWPLDIDFRKAFTEAYPNGSTEMQVLNHHLYAYLNTSTFDCLVTEAKPVLVILIKSAVKNYRHRSVIRETWGNAHLTRKLRVKVVFLLGRSFEILPQQECQIFQDIIQGDFIDTYNNNTLKTMMGFDWAVEFCKNVAYMAFADDDYFVATDQVLKLLSRLNSNDNVYYGEAGVNALPKRNPLSKWYVSPDVYPFRNYPAYIYAGFYTMTYRVARLIQIGIKYTQIFSIDDVYIGIVAQKLGLQPKNLEEISNGVIADHKMGNPDKVRSAWKSYLRSNS